MRPPSYYASIVKRNTGSGGGSGGGSYSSNDYDYSPRTSSQQLRSSLSSSSTSSYVSRSHLPFVPQSTLVAHCLAGVGSSTRPHGSASGGGGGPTPTSYRPYASSLSSSSYSSANSASLSSLSSRQPSTKYSPSSYSPAASYSRPPYLTSGSSSRYRPTTSASSYYKPIRLRERPLLTRISRPVASPTPPAEDRTTTIHSHESEPASRTRKTPSPSEQTAAPEAPDDWSSDVGRNISRNKYLIKFREFEKQAKAAEPTREALAAEHPAPVEPAAASGEEGNDAKSRAAARELGEQPPEGARMRLVGDEIEQQADKKVPVRRERKNVKVRLRPVAVRTGAKTRVEAEVKTKIEAEPAEEVEPAAAAAAAAAAVGAKTPKARREVKRSQASADKENRAGAKLKSSDKLASSSPAVEGDKPAEVAVATTTTTTSSAPKAKTRRRAKKEAEPKVLEAVAVAVAAETKTETEATSTPAARKPAGRIRFRAYNHDDFNFLTVLGHGGWGFVILAELKEHEACFAVKCIKKITIVEDDDYDSIMIERRVLALGNIHPFICKLFCTFETEGYLFFVMEYCPGGDLMFHVQHEGKFSEPRCRFYASEIICAIRFLHNRHIIYRDLKLDNILLDARGHIRLVDFGMCQCRTYREEMLPSNFCGTPEYISPEIIKGVPYNHSVDWWSFGVLLYEMAVGKMPFRGNDENELLWNVCYEQIHYPMFLSKELTSLLKLLLEREPSARMGMATCKSGDIYDQPFFRTVDWKAVEEMRVEPPFVPEVKSNRDVSNFDSDFTESTCELSPVDEATLVKIDQAQFQQFPYTNPDLFIFDGPPSQTEPI